MRAPSPTLCFTCGLVLSEPPRLNVLPNGSTCPACRDRLLDSLPPPLPSRPVLDVLPTPEGLDGTDDWTSPPGEERV